MLDSDLADLYEVPTFRLNEAVKRKIARFPSNFMFQLTKDEYEFLTSQFAISKSGRDGRRTLPYVFTEQGVAMLSSVLNSERAIQNKVLARRVSELENYFIEHCKDNKSDIREIYQAIDLLMGRTKPAKIGFKIEEN